MSAKMAQTNGTRKVEIEDVNGQLYLVTRIPITLSPEQIKISMPEADWLKGLTPQEARVLPLILEGKQNKEIAEEIGLSIRTVKFHVSGVLTKSGCQHRDSLRAAYTTAILFKRVPENGTEEKVNHDTKL